MSKKRLSSQIGKEFGHGLRETSRYTASHQAFQEQGLSEEVLNVTPPVGVNFALLAEQAQAVNILKQNLDGQLKAAFLGLASVEGITDLDSLLLTVLGHSWQELNVVDIDGDIIDQVNQEFASVSSLKTLNQDARNPEIAPATLNLTIRDHTDNCCPPAISREINQAVNTMTQQQGLALVNVTTSDILDQSQNRQVVSFKQAVTKLGSEIMTALQHDIFDLAQLQREFDLSLELRQKLRGKLIQIEPSRPSFVVFGEDTAGHGEWFRSWQDHLQVWQKSGFKLVYHHQREGLDSHQPPLHCRRHIVLLKKVVNLKE